MELQKKYRIHCVTDDKYEFVVQDISVAAPTECPVDSEHTVDDICISETIDNRIDRLTIMGRVLTSAQAADPTVQLPRLLLAMRNYPDVITFLDSYNYTLASGVGLASALAAGGYYPGRPRFN